MRQIVDSDDNSTIASITTSWIDVQVGDILEVRNNEQIPADMIILATSDEQGTAYIETSNIDGESNLKMKVAASADSKPLFDQESQSSEYQRKVDLFHRFHCSNIISTYHVML